MIRIISYIIKFKIPFLEEPFKQKFIVWTHGDGYYAVPASRIWICNFDITYNLYECCSENIFWVF